MSLHKGSELYHAGEWEGFWGGGDDQRTQMEISPILDREGSSILHYLKKKKKDNIQ